VLPEGRRAQAAGLFWSGGEDLNLRISSTPCWRVTRLRYRPNATEYTVCSAQRSRSNQAATQKAPADAATSAPGVPGLAGRGGLAVVETRQVVQSNLDDVAQEAREVAADVEGGLGAKRGGDRHLDDARAELTGNK
jgi:hypothetical protein